MVADEAVSSSWRKVVRTLEEDDRVSPRQRGHIGLAQAQGLIGNTLLLAVPNELTREVLQTQLKDSLAAALQDVFRTEILCAYSIDSTLTAPLESESRGRPRPHRSRRSPWPARRVHRCGRCRRRPPRRRRRPPTRRAG